MQRYLIIALALLALAAGVAGAADSLTIDKGPVGTNGASRALTVQDRQTTTYSYNSGAAAPGATPTDVVILNGPTNGRIARVRRITISTVQTTAGSNIWYIVKRSAPNTAGVGVPSAGVPHDSLSPAGSAIPTLYAAAPTPGTSAGTLWSGYVASPAVATAGVGNALAVIDFTAPGTEPVLLRNSREGLGVNFNGAALPAGMTANITITWTEEVGTIL